MSEALIAEDRLLFAEELAQLMVSILSELRLEPGFTDKALKRSAEIVESCIGELVDKVEVIARANLILVQLLRGAFAKVRVRQFE